MPFPSELVSHQYPVVRSRSYKSAQYASLCPNTVVFQASVNQTVFAASFASITYDNVTVGAYTDIREGQTVLVGPTEDIRDARFVGRARANNSGVVATTTLVGINETSADIENNWIVTVIDDYRMYHELGRVFANVYYKDYGKTFTQLKPIIYNVQSAYAGWAVAGQMDIAFSAAALAATSGATIASWSWDATDGGVIAGSASSANVTLRFPVGFRWIHVTVTDSGGRTQVRHIPVWVHSMAYLPALGFTGATINGDVDNGWSTTVDAFYGVDEVADNTLICIWNREYYDDDEYNFVSNVEFIGRLRREDGESASDETYSLLDKTSFELEGPMAQLSRISAPTITMRDAASPSVWDEIKNLTPWRAVAYILEHSTFHQLYSLRFDSTTNAYRAFELEAAQGNLFSSIQDLASSINAVLEWTPQGEAQMVREAVFQDEDDRNALQTVADWTANDFIRITPQRDHVETVGLVEGDGGTYAPTGGGIATTAVIPQLALAPGVAQGNAEGTSQLARQILLADVPAAVAQAELNQRLGDKLAKENLLDTLTVEMPDRYHWMVPSVSQWYTWTFVYRGISYNSSIRWWLKSITITHDNDIGTKNVSATFIRETQGSPGQTQDFPAPGTTEPAVPSIPVTQPYPNSPMLPDIVLPDVPTVNDLPPGWGLTPPVTTGDPVPTNGSGAFTFTESELWVTRLFISVPNWVPRTPDDMEGTIRDARLVIKSCYLLTSDGTNSWFYYHPDVFADNGWDEPAQLTGEYGLIAPASTSGAVYVQGVAEGQSQLVVVGPNFSPPAVLTFDPNTGEYTVEVNSINAPDDDYVIELEFTSGDCATFNYISAVGYTLPGNGLSDSLQVGLCGGGSLEVRGTLPAALDDTDVESYMAFRSHSAFTLVFTLTGDGGETVAMVTRYSTNDGETFAGAKILNAVPGAGGMDTVKIGTVALAAATGQIKKATSGGDWANYGDPLPDDFNAICLVMPRYNFGSTTVGNTSSTPQYLIASSVEDADGETMYKVTSSGTVFTPITPTVSGDKGLAVGPYCVFMPWWSGSIIAAVLQFGSLPRLVISTNGGSSWTDRGVINDSALMGLFRKGDKTMQQLFLANGQPAYSKNRGASIVNKSYPADYTTDPVIGIQVYG